MLEKVTFTFSNCLYKTPILDHINIHLGLSDPNAPHCDNNHSIAADDQ